MKVVLPFWNRPNYLRITLATIAESMRGRKDICLMLFDDGSKIIPDLVKLVPYTTIITRPKSLGPYASKSAAIDFTFKQFKDEQFLLTLDSDCVVHPGIYDACAKMMLDLPDMGIGTLFNADKHKTTKTVGKEYLIKDNIGGLGTIIKREVWEWYIKISKKERKHVGWDWDLCLWLNTQNKWKIYCTARSYVDHIGQSGSHSGPACPIDKAIRFLE